MIFWNSVEAKMEINYVQVIMIKTVYMKYCDTFGMERLLLALIFTYSFSA
jgi:hypothetical protein